MITKTKFRTCVCVVASFQLFAAAAGAATISPDLKARLQAVTSPAAVPVIVAFPGKADLSRFVGLDRANRAARANLVQTLKAAASRSQQSTASLLAARGVRDVRQLWLVNALACSAPPAVIYELAGRADVESIRLDQAFALPTEPVAQAASPEWNLRLVGAPELWAAGGTGAGVVVATVDSGVDAAHADLGGRFRGGTNSWFDPNGEHKSPYDASGHGTRVTGLLVGGAAGGTFVGMAPDAQWIAVKIFNDKGYASLSAIHAGFQWLLDPDGSPATNDAPDVVNCSWGFPRWLNQCYQEFAQDVEVLRTAGIAVVFAAGNNGPAAPSSESPADNPGSLAVGAVDESSALASFSGRGPAACDGTVFPEVVAPGVAVRTADLTFGGVLPRSYATVSGTSFAAPHIAGALALLWSVRPAASVSDLERAIELSAVDLGQAGADDAFGFGLLDVVAANELLGPSGPRANGDVFTSAEDTLLTVGAPGVLSNDAGADLVAVVAGGPSHGVLSLSGDGSFAYTPSADFSGQDTFTYTVTDGISTSPPATVAITITPVNDAPVASGEAYSATAGKALVVLAPGVLANDTDVDGDKLSAVLVTPPSGASAFSLGADGSLSYTARGDFSGTDSFSYQTTDGTGSSNVVDVTFTVSAPTNTAPAAAADAFTVVGGTTLRIAAPGVLANDSDADGDVLTAVLVSAPSHASAFTLGANGALSYTPASGYVGTDALSYRATDGWAESGTVSVTLTVSAPTNLPPVAVDDTASTRRNSSVNVKVLGNDLDPDGSLVASSVTVTVKPARGKVTVNTDGSIRYAAGSVRGSDSFKYTVKDNAGAVSNQATVVVTVQ